MSTTPATPKVGFVSLGCPKALVDSERILTQLRMEGYEVVPTYEDADVVVVNTCGFIDSAKAESLEVIGEAIKENASDIHLETFEKRLVVRFRVDTPGPQPTDRPGAATGHQADTAPLCVPENFRRLQPQLQLLHHPVDARQAGQPPGG